MILPLIEEFPFKEEADRSAALTAILAATIRPSLSVAPMYHVKAHQISSGKSYLCEIISAFASNQHNAPSSFPKNDEECGKVLLAEFMRGPAVIEFDNLTSDIYERGVGIGFVFTAFLVFVGSWIYCIASYGFLLGVGLGWLPSAIVAVIAGLVVGFGWPLVILGLVLLALYSL